MARIGRETIVRGEEGHAGAVPGLLIAAAGAVALGIGAATSGVVAIIGGVVLAVGIFASSVLNHVRVEWEFYDRLEKLEKK